MFYIRSYLSDIDECATKSHPCGKILNSEAEIPKDHSNALVLFDTLATIKNNVKVNILHLITFQ